MAALVPYQEQAAKAENKKFVPSATPASMQQYVVQYGVLAKHLDTSLDLQVALITPIF